LHAHLYILLRIEVPPIELDLRVLQAVQEEFDNAGTLLHRSLCKVMTRLSN